MKNAAPMQQHYETSSVFLAVIGRANVGKSTLFNAITDALAQIENQNYGDAKSTLIAAQQKAEEMYITAQN